MPIPDPHFVPSGGTDRLYRIRNVRNSGTTTTTAAGEADRLHRIRNVPNSWTTTAAPRTPETFARQERSDRFADALDQSLGGFYARQAAADSQDRANIMMQELYGDSSGGGGGYSGGGGGGGGGGGVAAQIAQQRAFLMQNLDAAMGRIAEQFTELTTELERQKTESMEKLSDARLRAVNELASVRTDATGRSEEFAAQQDSDVAASRAALNSDTAALLADLKAQGASTAATQERVAESQDLLAAQGAIGERLLDRNSEVVQQGMDRRQGTAELIGEGATTELTTSVAAALARAASDRSSQEFEVQDSTRQALQDLALQRAGVSGGGGGGRRGGGGGGGGGGEPLSAKDRVAIQGLIMRGATEEEALMAWSSGNLNAAYDNVLGFYSEDGPSTSDTRYQNTQRFLGTDSGMAALGIVSNPDSSPEQRQAAQAQIDYSAYAAAPSGGGGSSSSRRRVNANPIRFR